MRRLCFVLTLLLLHSIAPLPSYAQAEKNIALDSFVASELEEGTWEVWSFEVEADTTVTITLNSLHFDAYLELYNATETVTTLADDDDAGYGTNAQIREFTLHLAGTYRIFARSVDDEGSGKYILHLESKTAVGAVLENSTAMQDGTSYSRELGDFEPVYNFAATTEELITVTLESNEFDPFLSLMDAEGMILAENDDNDRGESNSAIVNFTIPDDGTYYLFVSAYEDNPTGEYTIEFYDTTTIEETPGGEIKFGEPATGTLAPNTYAEWRFEGKEDQVISVSAMTNPPEARLDLAMELYGPDDEFVDADEDSGLLFNPNMTGVVLPTDGEYRIRVFESLPTLGGVYRVGLAEGTTYFSPYAIPAQIIPLANGTATTESSILLEETDAYDLWLVTGVTSAPFMVTLQTSAGAASLDDFTLRIADTDWEFLAEGDEGSVVLDTLSPITNDYLILVEYTGRGNRDYQLIFEIADGATPTNGNAVPR